MKVLDWFVEFLTILMIAVILGTTAWAIYEAAKASYEYDQLTSYIPQCTEIHKHSSSPRTC